MEIHHHLLVRTNFYMLNKINNIYYHVAGRGYYTAITGYKNDATSIGGIYVHVSDDGWDRKGFIGI